MNDVTELLQQFYRDKLAQLLAHEAGSRSIAAYDVNNTYQYIINREETQLSWLATAILDEGGAVPESAPDGEPPGGGDRRASRSIIENDAREAQAFVDRWSPKVDAMTQARHRKMLRVILGETLEQKRFFEQALAGEVDLLGRRSEAAGARVGEVLSTRWIE